MSRPPLLFEEGSCASPPKSGGECFALLHFSCNNFQNLLFAPLQERALHIENLEVEIYDDGALGERQDEINRKIRHEILDAEWYQGQSHRDRHHKKEEEKMNHDSHALRLGGPE